MNKKSWIIIIVVSIITILIVSYGIFKMVEDKDGYDEVTQGDSLEEQYEDQNKEREDGSNETGETNSEDISNEKVSKLENVLDISEGTLVSKEQLIEDIKKWEEEGTIQSKEDSQGIAKEIEEKYGDVALESYMSSQLVSSEMNDYEINQLALNFSMEEVEDGKVYYDLKPYEIIKSKLNGEVEKEPTVIIGGSSEDTDNVDKYYYKDTHGFDDVEGNEVGYYSLVFYENTESTIKSFGDMGADMNEIGDLLGFNVVYYMKLDEEYTEDEIKDKISQVEINGNTGERMFELLSSQDEYIYPKDSLIKVNVPIDTKEVFGEEEELKVEIDWEEGKLKEPEIEIGGNKVKLEEHTEEEYLQGVTVEK